MPPAYMALDRGIYPTIGKKGVRVGTKGVGREYMRGNPVQRLELPWLSSPEQNAIMVTE